MSGLAPVATEKQRAALRASNRRVIAERLRWPAGVLKACEDLDAEHPGWAVGWLRENCARGWERPAGFCASRVDRAVIGADRVFGLTADDLRARIAAVEVRKAAKVAADQRRWESMRALGAGYGSSSRPRASAMSRLAVDSDTS